MKRFRKVYNAKGTYMNARLIRSCTVQVIAISLLFTCIGVANADHDYTGQRCGEAFNAVGDAIHDANFLGKFARKDEGNMFKKLNSAVKGVRRSKPAAIKKLNDIRKTATELANADKPKLEDASDIIAAIDAAIVCIDGLGGFRHDS